MDVTTFKDVVGTCQNEGGTCEHEGSEGPHNLVDRLITSRWGSDLVAYGRWIDFFFLLSPRSSEEGTT